jgi:hypothetical protein
VAKVGVTIAVAAPGAVIDAGAVATGADADGAAVSAGVLTAGSTATRFCSAD